MEKIINLLKRYFRISRSELAGLIYGRPAKNLKLIGVTGTSGKSTTAAMIYHILKNNGFKVGIISTVSAIAGEKVIDTGFHVTTPDPMELQKMLKTMGEEGIEYVVLETSSHALEQGRLGLMKFDIAVFTNIKRDHLDYHRTWESYADAKFELIKKLKGMNVLILNQDDRKGYEYIKAKMKPLNKPQTDVVQPVSIMVDYSKETEITDIIESLNGLHFSYKGSATLLPILGEYNLENVLAAIKVGEILKLNADKILRTFNTFKGLEGRMQIMQKEPFAVIVDFAHNTDSLEKSLLSAKRLLSLNDKLITVFGSAGLRDIEKRFTMGEAAGKLADIIIITAEDPRIESLYDINSEIIRGAEVSKANLVKRFKNHTEYLEFVKGIEVSKEEVKQAYIFVFDEESVQSRYDAIDFAIKLAQPGDVVIAEGKGHEKSLAFGTIEYPFTDQEAAERALGRR